MSGVKGRSGRNKSPSTIINQALARCDRNFPEIFQVVVDKALQGDKECAIYLIDRRLGKPHQSIDQRIKAAVLVTADDYEMASRLSSAAQQQVIDSIVQLPGITDATE